MPGRCLHNARARQNCRVYLRTHSITAVASERENRRPWGFTWILISQLLKIALIFPTHQVFRLIVFCIFPNICIGYLDRSHRFTGKISIFSLVLTLDDLYLLWGALELVFINNHTSTSTTINIGNHNMSPPTIYDTHISRQFAQ